MKYVRWRCFVFLVFFVFLYIGPTNLMPYDAPLAIVQQPLDVQRVGPHSIVATDYNVVIAADSDDDYWLFNETSKEYYSHQTASGVLYTSNVSTAPSYVGQMRFQLNIVKDATINSANLTCYELDDDQGGGDLSIRLIDEDNVGPLEDDGSKPSVDWSTFQTWTFDNSEGEWHTENVTTLVQNQTNLAGWASGQYIGFDFRWDSLKGSHQFEEYQNAGSNHAYLNISYTAESEDPYGANWLTGWSRRQQHNITQTAGTGANYTVPLYVWDGLGTSWLDQGYVSGYAQNDFDDIRFTQNNGSAELEYQLNTTWAEEATDYMSNNSEDFAAYPVNYPSAFYHEQRTYIGRHGINRDPFITYYDHENGTWAGWYRIGDNSILHAADDGHGTPALFVDDGGYIHAFWGGHSTVNPIQHSKSDSPLDITSWSLVNTIVWSGVGQTYPHLYYDATNDLLHMYVRTSTAGTQRYIEYRNSTDKGVTWSGAWFILDMSDAAPYFGAGEMDSTNTTLSIGFKRNEFGAGADDIYYLRANFSSKTVYNASGHSQGETVTDAELPNILVFNTSTCSTWYPNVHVDESDYPYMMWPVENSSAFGKGVIMFTYWTGSAWASIENVTVVVSYAAGYDFIVYDSTNITAFLSESASSNKNMTKYTWDGNTWTRVSAIVEGTRFLSFSTVPMHYDEEMQITFTEYIPNDVNIKFYAYGTDGFVRYTWSIHALFYVRVPDNLTDGNATIYLYYSNSGVSTTENATMEIDTGNDPDHNGWGAEEQESNNDATNDQTPTCANADDTDNLYAKYREYQITANVSDADGFADLDYLEISLYSNDRVTLYWTIRFDEDSGTFSEQSDASNIIELNTTASTNTSSGNTLNVTFYVEIHWNHTDLTDTDIKQYVTDDHPATDTDWYEVNYDVETRLDFEVGPAVDDALGTPDRGDIDGTALAFGTIQYLNSASNIRPLEGQIDVWISCTEYGSEVGPWEASNYEDSTGYFSYIVTVDNEVGLDTYTFVAVEEDSGSDGTDLMHTTQTDTYISDRLVINMQADNESPDNNVQVDFTLTVIYDYDDTVCTTYQIVISRNSVWWHSFTNANKSLFVDIDSNVVHSYTMSYLTNETMHGLTKFISNTEIVTWSAPVTTTTTTTETGIFYELFLSLNMWSYLGPVGLVIVGYYLSNKDKFLGVLWFVVECLFVAQYLALIDATPDYWWHIFILLLGGLFTCVYPLLNRK